MLAYFQSVRLKSLKIDQYKEQSVVIQTATEHSKALYIDLLRRIPGHHVVKYSNRAFTD